MKKRKEREKSIKQNKNNHHLCKQKKEKKNHALFRYQKLMQKI